MKEKSYPQKPISLEEFKSVGAPRGAQELMSRFNGGAFMKCHQEIFAETGIWVVAFNGVNPTSQIGFYYA